MPLLLALDLSTNVGWALMERGHRPTFGTLKLPPGSPGRRFRKLHEWLSESKSVFQFDGVAYERPILPRVSGDLATTMDTLTLLWGLCSTVQLFAEQRGLPCLDASVQDVKRAVTGSPRADKADMVAAAMTKWNWPVANDHEADAGGVGLVTYALMFPKVTT